MNKKEKLMIFIREVENGFIVEQTAEGKIDVYHTLSEVQVRVEELLNKQQDDDKQVVLELDK